MINTQYLFRELIGRGRRSIVNIGLIALVTCVLISIMLLAGALERSFHAPLNDIGANITVQKAGDVPEQMAGPVLPCSVAPIKGEQSRQIASLPGVQSISRAVLFWDFSDEAFRIVVGMQPNDPAGPALLRTAVTSGRMFTPAETSAALAETVWAGQAQVNVGDRIRIGGRPFTIVGLVDASRVGRIGTANLYITLAAAQNIAAESAGVAAVHNFTQEDSNILFIQADRDKTEAVASAIKELMGEKTSVSTPDSFKKLLGSLFSLTQRFSGIVSIMIFLIALLLMVRNSAATIRERTKEIGIMKAVGWTGADIRGQLLAENCLYIVLGTVVGLVLGSVIAWGLSHVTVAIPIPWDMAPKPHFLPGGDEQLFRQVRLRMEPGLRLLIPACVAPLLLGLATVWTAGNAVTKLQTSEVLRYE